MSVLRYILDRIVEREDWEGQKHWISDESIELDREQIDELRELVEREEERAERGGSLIDRLGCGAIVPSAPKPFDPVGHLVFVATGPCAGTVGMCIRALEHGGASYLELRVAGDPETIVLRRDCRLIATTELPP